MLIEYSPMQRPVGVTISAIVAILGSLGFVLMGVMMMFAFIAGPAPPQIPYAAVVGFVMAFLLFAIAGWGLATAIALFQLRPWARWSTLIFSGLMAAICSISMLAVALFPIPQTPEVPQEATAMVPAVSTGIVAFYGVFVVLGIVWLVYFTRSTTIAAFGPTPPRLPGSRPLSISVIGWYQVVSAVCTAVLMVTTMPANMLASIFEGLAAKAIYAAWTAAMAISAYGLLKLKRWGHYAALAFFAFSILNGLIFTLTPGLQQRMLGISGGLSAPAPNPPVIPTSMLTPMMIVSLLLYLMPVWFLIKQRPAFRT